MLSQSDRSEDSALKTGKKIENFTDVVLNDKLSLNIDDSEIEPKLKSPLIDSPMMSKAKSSVEGMALRSGKVLSFKAQKELRQQQNQMPQPKTPLLRPNSTLLEADKKPSMIPSPSPSTFKMKMEERRQQK